MTAEPDLSIIVVNWNSAAFVRKCLSSIYANAPRIDFEILVVNNASYDGCEELVRNEFPEVHFIQNPQNEGFSRANNLGFRRSKGRNLLFLNPDTEVVGGALDKMVSFLDSTPDAGVVGARLLNSDGSVQTSCIQRFPTILNQVLDIERLHLAFPRCPLWNIGPLFEMSRGGVSVDVISGACLLIHRSVFEEAGQFNTDYFMFSDNVDLCWKAKRLGLKNYYLGEATVIHHGGKSTLAKPGNNFSDVMMRESRWKFLKASRGGYYAGAYRLTTAIAALCRLALIGTAKLLTLGKFRTAQLVRTFSKWKAILRWAIRRERPGQQPAPGKQQDECDGRAANVA